jgi:1-acyl-sn-glycerol-3-phosphate acyltransferase
MPDVHPSTGNKVAGRLARSLGAIFLFVFGWRVEGALPEGTKAVVIAAPHTSNWDMPFMLAVAYVLGIRPSWLGKRELFGWPFGGFMRFLGGLPVDRSARRNVVQQVVDLYAASDRLYVVIPPSATRSRAVHWKSGFYHIARGAGVPVMCTFLDYRRKVGGVGPVFHPTGDVAADMDVLRTFYAGVTGKFPALTTPVRLVEEGEVAADAAGASKPNTDGVASLAGPSVAD